MTIPIAVHVDMEGDDGTYDVKLEEIKSNLLTSRLELTSAFMV